MALSITYELLALSGTTTIPGTSVKFAGFGDAPAIDKLGNVVFTGGGTGRSGVYSFIDGVLAKVADTATQVPGRATNFYDFSGSERHDIDAGKVVFKAYVDSTRVVGLYTNAGGSLVEITRQNIAPYYKIGEPWLDAGTVGFYYQQSTSVFGSVLWNGSTITPVNFGTGYAVGYGSQSSVSNSSVIAARAKVGSFQMGIATGANFEVLATANTTVMPGLGVVFINFGSNPVIDQGGDDVAFLGTGS
jgi:hypothetical protein